LEGLKLGQLGSKNRLIGNKETFAVEITIDKNNPKIQFVCILQKEVELIQEKTLERITLRIL
jgi:hypothetical protein